MGGAFIDTQSYSVTVGQNLLTAASPDGGLTKKGIGTLTLAGSDNYNGGTNVTAGILSFASTLAEPSSGTTTVAPGATLGLGVGTSAPYFLSSSVDNLFANTLPNVSMNATSNVGIDTTAANFTYATSVVSGRGLVKLGPNVLTLTGTNAYTGGTSVNAGALTFSATYAEPSSGTTTVAAGATLGLGVGASAPYFPSSSVDSLFANTLANVSMNATSNVGIDTTAGNFTYPSSVPATNTYGLVKLGANTLYLTGADAYTGATQVSSGTLNVNGSLAGSSVLVNGPSSALVEPASGVIGGAAATFTVSNSGSATLAGNNTYAGATTVAAGATLSLTGTIVNSGGITTSGAFMESTASAISGGGGPFTVAGGTTTLAGLNSYTGHTNVNAGTLIFSGDAPRPPPNCSSATTAAPRPSSRMQEISVSEPATSGQDVVSLGGAGGYGFYLLNGGSLTTGQVALGGSTAGTNTTGVFDVKNGSALTVCRQRTGWIVWVGWAPTPTV